MSHWIVNSPDGLPIDTVEYRSPLRGSHRPEETAMCRGNAETCQCAGSKGLARIAHTKAERMGFLTADDLAVIAADPVTRLTLVLVRCGGGRFLSPADQTKHFIDIIERDRKASANDRAGFCGDYVRDVSLMADRA